MVKDYWTKRMKKLLQEEESLLTQEVNEAVRKKLAESQENDPESEKQD